MTSKGQTVIEVVAGAYKGKERATNRIIGA